MSDGRQPARRVQDAPVGRFRRLFAALSRGLYRTLAEDDDAPTTGSATSATASS